MEKVKRRKIEPMMINELKRIYISEGLATFEKTLLYLNLLDGIAKEDVLRIEKIVKLECFTEKLRGLALSYLQDDSVLNKQYIHLELRYLGITNATFLMLVNEFSGIG